MTRLVRMVRQSRASRRYPGCIRITLLEYRRALLRLLREDAADLIEIMRLRPVMEDLDRRVNEPGRFAVDRRLTRRILNDRGTGDPLKVKAYEFNRQAEAHYRQELRQHHIREAFAHFRKAVGKMDSWPAWRSGRYNRDLVAMLGGRNLEAYLTAAERGAVKEDLSPQVCEKLIGLLLLVFHQGKSAAAKESR